MADFTPRAIVMLRSLWTARARASPLGRRFMSDGTPALLPRLLTAPVFLRPRISVIGVGGAGSNTVDNMIARELDGIDFVVANTDAQALSRSLCSADNKLQIGKRLTSGLGAGAAPDIGRQAAEDDVDSVLSKLQDSHMAFITAGMGGGTGTGASPVIARAVRSMGILTVGIVTKPFLFEGKKRMKHAVEGIAQLQREVDTLIVVPNQRVLALGDGANTFNQSFEIVNNVLYDGVKAVTDVIVKPGLINLDFADVKTIMAGPGWGLMGTGTATGKDRAVEAALAALNNPLLDTSSRNMAKGVLVSIAGGSDLGLLEIDSIVNEINNRIDGHANVIFGATADESLEGKINVSLIITGPWENEEEEVVEQEVKPKSPPKKKRKTEVPKRATLSKKESQKAEEGEKGFWRWF